MPATEESFYHARRTLGRISTSLYPSFLFFPVSSTHIGKEKKIQLKQSSSILDDDLGDFKEPAFKHFIGQEC